MSPEAPAPACPPSPNPAGGGGPPGDGARRQAIFLAFARATPSPPAAGLAPFLTSDADWASAEQALATLLAKEPDDAPARRLLLALAQLDPARVAALPQPPAPLLAVAAEARLLAGDPAGAEVLVAAGRARAPADPGLRLRAAMLAARLGDPAEAVAALRSWAPSEDGEGDAAIAYTLDALLARGASAAAIAVLHGPAARGRPGLRRRFVEAGLDAFRRSLNDAPDLVLLEAVASAAADLAATLPPALLAEIARLAESMDRDDLLDRLAAPLVEVLDATDPPPPWLAAAAAALTGGEPLPLDGAALTQRGLALHAAGRLARAGLCFALALRLAPDDPAIRLNAGFAAAAAGRREEAVAAFAGVAGTAEEGRMRRLAWPVAARSGGIPWPYAPPDPTLVPPLPPGAVEWPLVTIITPALNAGRWLEEAILSVLHQGYPRLQYVIVDGGSTDATPAILARHRAAIDTVIVEPDNGQAEALNKGLARARGELVGWLNADDMLAPGALHAAAAAWLAEPETADILHGPCIVHRDRAPTALQAPRLAPGEFTVEALSDVFGRWMDGAFFLQPEALFTRRLLEALGGRVDEGLHYAFDYAFWLAAARHGARPRRVDWPIAFYRLRQGQKTGNRTASVMEQLTVRDRWMRPAPSPERHRTIVARLRAAFGDPAGAGPTRLVLFDPRLPRTPAATRALAHASATLEAAGVTLQAVHAADLVPPEADIVLRVLRAHDGPDWAAPLRGRFHGPLAGWFVEPERDPFANAALAKLVDLAVPASAEAMPVLANDLAVLLPPSPAVPGWPEAPGSLAAALAAIVGSMRALAGEAAGPCRSGAGDTPRPAEVAGEGTGPIC
jgi:GT2 family glycosyltransferase/tetratricopeptide (TPR) repeat protein